MNIIEIITYCIDNKKPISYSKYGDGEYLCCTIVPSLINKAYNCDKDLYTAKKRIALIQAFQYMVDNASNAYIGQWPEDPTRLIMRFWTSLVSRPILWADYHTFILEDKDFYGDSTFSLDRKINMYKAIKSSSLKKIYVCNELLIKAKGLLNIDELVIIPLNNWFDDYFEQILQLIIDQVKDEERFIVMTSCGMAAKIIIAELHKRFPRGIYLDIGSALDFICTSKDTRGRMYTYYQIYTAFKDLIPSDWKDDKYNHIHPNAQKYLGTHIPEKK